MASQESPNEVVQEKAYAALSSIFSKYAKVECTLVIEILPPDLDPPDGELYLEDETEYSVGIPKKVLVAGFLKARSVFSKRAEEGLSGEEILAATQIILLFDPEYLTVANYRKAHLFNLFRAIPESALKVVPRELRFLNCILTSPLHRQSKSPTLWFHRYVIARTFYVSHATNPSPFNLDEGFILDELEIVLKAAERHQHNYYAFQYARRLYARFHSFNEYESVKVLLQKCLENTSTWCRAHPSDTSGWSFLLFLLQMHGEMDWNVNSKVVQECLRFATKTQWKGEALWHFLRTVVDSEISLLGDKVVIGDDIRDGVVTLAPFGKRAIHDPGFQPVP